MDRALPERFAWNRVYRNQNVKYWQYNSGQYNGSNSQVDGITKETGELVSVDVNVEFE